MSTVNDALDRLRKRADDEPTPWVPDPDDAVLCGVIEDITYEDTKFASHVPKIVLRNVPGRDRRSYLISQAMARREWDEQEPVIGDAILVVYRGERDNARGGNPTKVINIYVERLNAESVEDADDPWPDFDEPGEPDPPNTTRW
jgi:hypothetical protein